MPRTVSVGVREGERIEIREGLREGERVVASGVFLIDSESRVRASGAAGAGHAHGTMPMPSPTPTPTDLVEDQITYPLVTALQSTPRVRTVRGYSMFGMSFVYLIFETGTDLYWARTRVNEQLDRVRAQLPPDVSPTLGPDATGVGWVYQYALVDASGDLDLAELRALHDFTVRPALQSVTGVAEVASFGGFERQYQIVLDPNRLAVFGIAVSDVSRAVRDSNSEVGARVIELSGREYVLRGRGYVHALSDLEASVVVLGSGGTPCACGTSPPCNSGRRSGEARPI